MLDLKNCPNIPQSCLNKIHGSFYKNWSFSKQPKIQQSILGYFCCQELPKIAQSGHTVCDEGFPHPFLGKLEENLSSCLSLRNPTARSDTVLGETFCQLIIEGTNWAKTCREAIREMFHCDVSMSRMFGHSESWVALHCVTGMLD